MRVATVLELVERNGVPVPSGLTETGWRFSGPEDFIAQYIAVCGLMTRLEDYQRLGREVAEDLAATGVRYAEAVFTPSAHAATMGEDWFGPIEALLDGLAAGERATGTAVRLTPDVVRDAGMDAGRRTLEVARKFAGRGVVALNCAGSEVAAIAPFASLFAEAKEAGLGSVPHAGEWAGPENVWETLEHYAPDRIGHGVRAIDDPQLVETLAERRIPLEVSPLSNVATGVYPSLEAHPFLRLRKRGRGGDAQLRRSADVRRRMAHPGVRGRPPGMGPERRGARRDRPDRGGRLVRRRRAQGRAGPRDRRLARRSGCLMPGGHRLGSERTRPPE